MICPIITVCPHAHPFMHFTVFSLTLHFPHFPLHVHLFPISQNLRFGQTCSFRFLHCCWHFFDFAQIWTLPNLPNFWDLTVSASLLARAAAQPCVVLVPCSLWPPSIFCFLLLVIPRISF